MIGIIAFAWITSWLLTKTTIKRFPNIKSIADSLRLPFITLGTIALVMTWDAYVLFVYIPYKFAAGIVISILILLFIIDHYLKYEKIKFYKHVNYMFMFSFVIFIIMLPELRTSYVKSFFLDCKSIEGMDIDEARKIMLRYIEVKGNAAAVGLPDGLENASMSGVVETTKEKNNRILFIPSSENSMDWCVAYPEGDKVERIVIHPD